MYKPAATWQAPFTFNHKKSNLKEGSLQIAFKKCRNFLFCFHQFFLQGYITCCI